MLAYLKGTVAEIQDGFVNLEVGGVGYELAVSSDALSKLAAGDAVKLYVHMAVREDDVALYGFLSKNEKNMFLRLISVSGVGCKVALAILSGLSVHSLAQAVTTGDLAALSSIKGIGKKTAERIVLELKDKLIAEFGGGNIPVVSESLSLGAAQEAILALVSLGYSKAEANMAVSKIAGLDRLSVEQILLLVLKS